MLLLTSYRQANPSPFRLEPPIPVALKLTALDNVGLRIDPAGRLVNWADWPPSQGRPVMRSSDERQKRHKFEPEEEDLLRRWHAAAEQEHIAGDIVHDQLESVVSPPTCRLR